MHLIYLTLLHSLWQGILLVLVAGLVLLFTRRATAALRYRLLTGCLGLFTAAVACTLVQLIRQRGGFAASAAPYLSLPLPSSAVWTRLNEYLTAHAAPVVGCWMTIVGIRSIRMTLGLHRMYQLRRTDVFDAGRYWQQRVTDLAGQLGIHRRVRIPQSALAKAPLVIGHFKPLILMPIGLMNQLTTGEVEAILRHELAHIRRRDFLVNLLQSVLETLFFFNPAVRWLNKLIREERELCCDDLAVNGGGVAEDYVRALVFCQSFLPARAGLAMAFAASENQLLNRVRRILRQPEHASAKPLKRGLASILLVMVLICLVLFRLDGVGTQTVVRRSVEERERERIVTEEVVREPALKALPVSGEHRSSLAGTCAANPAGEQQAAATAEQQDDTAQQSTDAHEKAKLMVCEAAGYDPLAAVANNRQPGAFTEQDGKNLRDELESDGLIRQHTTFSYKLNNEELVINDQRQPDSIHRRYAAKYVQQTGRSILYNYNYTCGIAH